jgi:hypothetical protein
MSRVPIFALNAGQRQVFTMPMVMQIQRVEWR